MPAAKRIAQARRNGQLQLLQNMYISRSSWTSYNHKKAKTNYDFIIAELDIDRLMGFFLT